MSDTPQGPDWWQASDGKFYPPQAPMQPPTAQAGQPYAPPGWGQAPPIGQSYPPPLGGPPYQPPVAGRPPRSGGVSAGAALVAAILFWPLGIVLGHIARARIKRTGERGAGMALAALIISYVWGAIVILLVVFALSASNPIGFKNLATLQSSVSQQIDANLHNPSNAGYSPGTTVTSVECVHKSGTQYVCLVRLSKGTPLSVPVTVSADGSRWVSNG
jgi:hypothetical protein